ncbi:copper transporter 6-like [Phalaenopsis equestris]|uniref:copper transporter 6-like n=1 Tax=Phalaenopsis equestris TaxID=78828 RepID=UPI0009E2022E|nr:copper transporter 6-like [Phalaenopsis equestris]
MDRMVPLPASSPNMAAHGQHGMMHMTFFWGDRVQILFSGWPGDRGFGVYLLALFLVAIAAAAVECLSTLSRRHAQPPTASAGARASIGLALTVLHTLQMGLLYLVMLAVMSFNVGVLIAAVLGHAVGYFIAGSGTFNWAGHGGGQISVGPDFAKC